jgi:hypothetical protein
MSKKISVILISSLLVVVFILLVYFGFRQRRGTPVAYEAPESAVLEIPYLEEEIDLSQGISLDKWEKFPTTNVELMYQVTILPWPKRLVPVLTVKAFHNERDIYFYLSWEDENQNREHDISAFSDACAIMFPLEEVRPTTIMMGFLSETNIWQWKASQDREFWEREPPTTRAYSDFYYPFEEEELFPVSKDVPQSAANDLLAIRVGTVTPKERQIVRGRGIWADGIWHVVFLRSFQAEDSEVDVGFEPGKSRFCAFGVWNGEEGDRGGRKSISEWVELRIK